MKNLIISSSIAALLLSTTFAFADGAHPDHDREDFAKHKAEMVKHVNDEKAMVDQFASCVNSSQSHDDMKKCHEARHSAQEKMQEHEKEMRRAHLQDELKKLDEPEHKK